MSSGSLCWIPDSHGYPTRAPAQVRAMTLPARFAACFRIEKSTVSRGISRMATAWRGWGRGVTQSLQFLLGSPVEPTSCRAHLVDFPEPGEVGISLAPSRLHTENRKTGTGERDENAFGK